MEAQFSGLLYSKRNVELGYKLKMTCRSYGISVVNIERISTLLYLLEHSVYDFLFIDCSTITLTDYIMDYIEDFHFRGALKVIFIDAKTGTFPEGFTVATSSNLDYVLSNEISKIGRIDSSSCKPQDNISFVSNEVVNFLIGVGITPKYLGYMYIKDIVIYSLITGKLNATLSTEIYPIIASMHKTTPENIERNIRNCLHQATKSKAYIDNLYPLLGSNPTNRTFLVYAIDYAMDCFSKSIAST